MQTWPEVQADLAAAPAVPYAELDPARNARLIGIAASLLGRAAAMLAANDFMRPCPGRSIFDERLQKLHADLYRSLLETQRHLIESEILAAASE
jgi:hypothetical protein